jgi:hypothetical protein
MRSIGASRCVGADTCDVVRLCDNKHKGEWVEGCRGGRAERVEIVAVDERN